MQERPGGKKQREKGGLFWNQSNAAQITVSQNSEKSSDRRIVNRVPWATTQSLFVSNTRKCFFFLFWTDNSPSIIQEIVADHLDLLDRDWEFFFLLSFFFVFSSFYMFDSRMDGGNKWVIEFALGGPLALINTFPPFQLFIDAKYYSGRRRLSNQSTLFCRVLFSLAGLSRADDAANDFLDSIQGKPVSLSFALRFRPFRQEKQQHHVEWRIMYTYIVGENNSATSE